MGWKKLDPDPALAGRSGSIGTQIGCSWCVDYGYYEGMHDGIDPEKVRASLSWRESTLFDERERVVLEYAEAATADARLEVSEELAARLHAHFERCRDRRAGGVGGSGELPLPLQCRPRTAEPGFAEQLRRSSAGQGSCPLTSDGRRRLSSRSGARLLFGIAYRMLGSAADAEDIVQEA
jgi:hypothetical protein